jgi:hypothetical protein
MYPELAAGLEAARTRLGPAAVAEAERSGRARDLDDVIAWALEMPTELALA